MIYEPAELFSAVQPGHFESEHIRSLPPERIYEEQVLDLHAFSTADMVIPCPEGIVFGIYEGEMAPLHAAVSSVEDG